MSVETLVTKAKAACRVTTSYYDDEITDLVNAALADLPLGNVTAGIDMDNPLIIRAVCTYCKMNLGNPENYDRLKASYDEQKAQLGTATGFTVWEAEP